MSNKTKNIIIVVLSVALVYSFFSRHSSADLEDAYQDGFNSGYKSGYDAGNEDGYKKGYEELKPVKLPENGAILSGREYDQSEITVTASDQPFVVSLKTTGGVERVVFFVRAWDTVTIGVPGETLNVYFATGKKWYGYGRGLMFGEDTVYSKDSKSLDFENYTWEYTLYPVTNGNFSQSPSTEYEFF